VSGLTKVARTIGHRFEDKNSDELGDKHTNIKSMHEKVTSSGPKKTCLRDVGNERERADSRARLFALTGTSVGNEYHSKKDSCVDAGKWWYRVRTER